MLDKIQKIEQVLQNKIDQTQEIVNQSIINMLRLKDSMVAIVGFIFTARLLLKYFSTYLVTKDAIIFKAGTFSNLDDVVDRSSKVDDVNYDKLVLY